MRTLRLSLCLLLAGCASASGENPFSAGPGGGRAFNRGSGPVEVLVINNGFPDMHLYVIQSGPRMSLGMVTGLTRYTFTLPRTFVASGRAVQILADPIGGFAQYVTPYLYAYPGQRIRVQIQNAVNLSTARVEDTYQEEEEDTL